jgi:hypothetical protein
MRKVLGGIFLLRKVQQQIPPLSCGMTKKKNEAAGCGSDGGLPKIERVEPWAIYCSGEQDILY